jgi:hypothetical protein
MKDLIDVLMLLCVFIFVLWILIKYLFKSLLWLIEKLKYLLIISVAAYFAYNFTVYFLWAIGSIFVISTLLALLSLAKDSRDRKILNKNIEFFMKNNDNVGLCEFFSKLDTEKKKQFILLLKQNKTIANNEATINYLLACDFIGFANNYRSGNYIIIEKEKCTEYLSELWGGDFLKNIYQKIDGELGNPPSSWKMSEETPTDPHTGEIINLIKLTKNDADVFEDAIILD